MMNDLPQKMSLESTDVAADRIGALREVVPEAFTETGIDWDALRRTLGEWVDPGKERFGLNWTGKAECMRIIQQPSVGTLLPMREESVDFDNTGNIIIEGDNLEVLKLLQKSYYGKVKMIYIDPPYNTGNGFIYPDNFREGLQDYLRYSGQTDEEGIKLSANVESDGRFHSKWLNMMYPRLFLARNLLKDDGVLFASVGDDEISNLRLLLDDLYGPENFIACVARVAKKTSNKGTHFSPSKDYVLAYARSISYVSPFYDEQDADYASRFKDTDDRGSFATVGLYQAALDPMRGCINQRYYVQCPDGTLALPPGEVFPQLAKDGAHVPPQTARDKVWRWSYQSYFEKRDLLVFKETRNSPLVNPRGEQSKWNVYTKYYLEDRLKDGRRPRDFLSDVTNDKGTSELAALGIEGFPFPKPTALVRLLMTYIADPNALVLDFFAGSGTTGDAVLRLNAADGGRRRYVLIQLPESIDQDAGFPTVSALCRERMRRAGQTVTSGGGVDVGFQSYRLSTSNFRSWNGQNSKSGSLQTQLSALADNTIEGRSENDILAELLLKAGFPLTAPVERLQLADKSIFSVSDGALLLGLDEHITIDLVEEMAQLDPQMIICLDEGFRGDDQLKVNAMQTVNSRNRNAATDIVFRVV